MSNTKKPTLREKADALRKAKGKADTITINLPSGLVAEIDANVSGQAMLDCQRFAGNDQQEYVKMMMSKIVKIDGDTYLPEDFPTLPLEDFSELAVKLGEQGFL